ncbi:hypothetical protein CRYUN_Cryun23aG0110500 [Craigia yunnanensis]
MPRQTYHFLISLYAGLAKLKDFGGLKQCFEEWESSCSVYDMREVGVLFSRARECFMVYFLKKRRFDLALNHMEAAVSEINYRSPSYPETMTAFFDYFMNKGDVDAAEEFCKFLKNNYCLDSDDYHGLLRTYVAAGKVAPDTGRRLEDGYRTKPRASGFACKSLPRVIL